MRAVLLLLGAVVCLTVGNGSYLAAQYQEKSGAVILRASAEGTRFMVGFMQNEISHSISGWPVDGMPPDMRLLLSSRSDATVTIRFSPTDTLVVRLKQYQSREIAVPSTYECVGEGVFAKGIEIVSDRAINVYCYNSKRQTSDGYLALPVSTWGDEYVVASYAVDHYTADPGSDPFVDDMNLAPRRGELAVMAAEDSTVVTVWPVTTTLSGAPARSPYRRTLARGEIFQVQDGGSVRGRSDLTGSRVTSSRPVGVLSGHVRTGVTTVHESKDHLVEMLPPRTALGLRHIAIPFAGRQGGDIIRVITSEEGPTTVTTASAAGEKIVTTLSGRGEFHEFRIESPTVITTDKPTLVVQYSQSAGVDPRNRPRVTVNFDPDMLVLTPEEQFVNTTMFQTLPNISQLQPEIKQYDHHYLTIVVDKSRFSSVALNGSRLADLPGLVSGAIVGTPYLWATIEVDQGSAHVLTGSAKFTGYVYGTGGFDSYAWPLGGGLRDLVSGRDDPPADDWIRVTGVGRGTIPKEGRGGILGANAEGTRFWVGFMQNEISFSRTGWPYDFDGQYFQQTISLASRFATTVQITPASGGPPVTVTLAPYVPQTIGVGRYYENIGEGVARKGIEITSTLPISVYCYSAERQTSDGYLALPVSSWGKQYVSSNFAVDHYSPEEDRDSNSWYRDDFNLSFRRGEFAVIASEDTTMVTIWPATSTLGGGRRGQPYRRRLNKGDVFQVQDSGESRGVEDLTGSVITADKPIGVLSGHVRAGVPTHYDSKDHLIEMLPPRNTLGSRHIVVPFGGRQGGDLVRIIAAFDGMTTLTLVSPGGTVTEKLIGVGEFYQLPLREVTVITSDKPVMVTQYAQSAGVDPRNRPRVTVNFDPDMVVITPEEQFVNAAVFQTLPNIPSTNDYQQFNNHYVTIVAERSGFASMKVDGVKISALASLSMADIPNTPFLWATFELPEGEAHVIAGDALFGGYVYGLGTFDSYAWPVGSGLRKFDLPPDTIPPGLRSTELCGVHEYFASDSGYFASGLRSVRLDTSYSQNVEFTQTLLIIGDEVSLGRLKLINPRRSGRARLIAVDLDGNRKQIDINLESTAPLFTTRAGVDRDSIYFGILDINVVGRDTLRITNDGTDTLRLDKVLLLRNREFLFDNPQTYQNRVLNPGQSIDVKILFLTTERKTHRDTIVVTSGCIDYMFPLAVVIPNPGILSGPAHFDKVRVGTSKTMQVTVRNPGQAKLVIDRINISGAVFSAEFVRSFAAPLELAPGAEKTFDVVFSPTNVIDYRDSITFYSNADSVESAILTGRGIYPYLIIGGHDYGRIQVGRDSSAVVMMTNLGTDYATATGVRLETPEGFITTPFPDPVHIAEGRSIMIPVPITFRPTEEKAYLTRIFLLNDDGLEALDSLKGTGFMLRASIDSCDWDRRWVGSSHDTVRFVRNVGREPVTITNIEIVDGDVGEFRIIDPLPDPVTLQPGDILPIGLQFSPLFRGERSARIRALTSSTITPEIYGELLGFGIEAGASDLINFTQGLIYSCEVREGEITIENTGNTDLTIATMALESDRPLVTLVDAPSPGDVIGAGENRQIDFTAGFGGESGPVTARVSWSFVELSGTFSREFTLDGRVQEHSILATTPATVGIGGKFELAIEVEKVVWVRLPEKEVTLEIEFNPTVARFDAARWQKYVDTITASWKPANPPIVSGGRILLTLKPSDGISALLDSVMFIPIPFEGYLGNNRLDTFDVVMTVGNATCAPPSLASVPYAVDSICGLHQRLFELTGPAYRLAQNLPNPVRLKTQIDFTLGMDAETTLEIFASDGRLVATPIRGVMPAGDYSVPVDASDLPSGLYYYRLQSGAFSATRQMRVTK